MKVNQLRDFVAVAEAGSLRAAARRLGLAQPAITRSIQELEHALGAQLFVREARGVRPTGAGRELLPRATAILGDLRRAREAVGQHQGGTEGELVVALSIAGHLGILGRVVRPFRRRYPGVRLRVLEGLFPAVEADLHRGAVDLYVGPLPAEAARGPLAVTPLMDTSRVVIARRGHPLAGAQRLEQLAGADWLGTILHPEAAAELAAAFARRGLPPPRMACECQSALSVLTLLLNSDLLALAPRLWTAAPLLAERLAVLPLAESFAAPPLQLAHRAGIGLTPAGEHFAHLVVAAARRAAGPGTGAG